jgi:putative ABC transport system substrate-binding protein
VKVVNSQWSVVSKNIFVFAFCAMLLALCASIEAQQTTKIPRIGYVAPLSLASEAARVNAFRHGLRELKYLEGTNIQLEFRYAEGKPENIPLIVSELVKLKLDILVTEGLTASRAAKKLTGEIPIVTITSADLVSAGLVGSLARPGGNITGLTRFTRELSGKRLELFKEIIPRMSRAGILLATGATAETAAMGFKEYETAANALKIELELQQIRDPNPDLAGAFEAFGRERAQGVIVIISPLIRRNTKTIVDLASKTRLPSMFEAGDFVEAGGLVSYQTDEALVFRRAATYVDKILKGAKPADLPVEQPTKFEFVVNLKTAKQIGLTIPPNVLARADRVIR